MKKGKKTGSFDLFAALEHLKTGRHCAAAGCLMLNTFHEFGGIYIPLLATPSLSKILTVTGFPRQVRGSSDRSWINGEACLKVCTATNQLEFHLSLLSLSVFCGFFSRFRTLKMKDCYTTRHCAAVITNAGPHRP